MVLCSVYELWPMTDPTVSETAAIDTVVEKLTDTQVLQRQLDALQSSAKQYRVNTSCQG